MKKLLAVLGIACCLCGCMNINARICDKGGATIEPYFCTVSAAEMCYIIAIPQTMAPERHGFMALNILSIPLGLCCFVVDVPLEAVCDTLCLPYDWYQTSKAEKEYR